jgi:hypothetical protein
MFKEYSDHRGVIQEICKGVDVLRITSKKDTIRANHYHKATNHWCLVHSGVIAYFERPVGSDEIPTIKLFYPGEIFYTGPMLEHTMLFLQDTEFWCFSGGDRTQENYENDLVRIPVPLNIVYENYGK